MNNVYSDRKHFGWINSWQTLIIFSLVFLLSTKSFAQHEHHQMQENEMNETFLASNKTEHRDPHAYANGTTLMSGDYALGNSRHLHLADEHNFWAVNLNRLEYVKGEDDTTASFDVQAWYGRSYDKLVVKLEGEITGDELEEMQSDLLWSHAISPFWDTQLGVRIDSGEGHNRSWLAFGVQGLAPYWFEVDATAYITQSGRTALQLEAEYELLLAQRLVLQPRVELNFYGKDDAEKQIGTGLSDVSAGLRLRYEFSRQFAPYVGIDWTGKFGNTAEFAEDNEQNVSYHQWLVGIRAWF